MPDEHSVDSIGIEYTVFTYLPLLLVVGCAARQMFFRLNPPADEGIYQQHAEEICDVFSRLSRVDVKQMGPVLKQLPYPDLMILTSARNLLMEEVLMSQGEEKSGISAMMSSRRLGTNRQTLVMMPEVKQVELPVAVVACAKPSSADVPWTETAEAAPAEPTKQVDLDKVGLDRDDTCTAI